jgi:hypothetical protein
MSAADSADSSGWSAARPVSCLTWRRSADRHPLITLERA